MKKTLISVLILYSTIFLLGGIYIAYTINSSVLTLNDLVTLHQVDILREHLMVELRGAQTELSLHNTRHSKGADSLVYHVTNVDEIITTCFDCHHEEKTREALENMSSEIVNYKHALSRVFTLSANSSRVEAAEDVAYNVGEKLIDKSRQLTSIARRSLDQKTISAIHKIELTRKTLFFLVIAGFVLSLLMTALLIRAFTKPVNILLKATRQLKKGDLDHRIEGLKAEFGELASSFNEMAGSLKNQMHKMQRTEQMVVCGEMTTRLAHEIKNPLAGIKLSMEVLYEDSSITPVDRDVLKKVIEEVLRIEQMIRGLLNFARPAEPQFMKINVEEVLEKTLALYQKYSPPRLEQSKRIEIVTEVGSPLPEIEADPFQMQQIFLNLFLNASDAMPDGGKLLLKIYHDVMFQTLQIEVSDTGTGIQEEMLGRLFQPFFTTKAKGTGLGLTITQQLVEQHHGLISVKNNPDGGATFKISFPLDGRGKGNV